MDLNKRPDDMVRITTPELAQAFIEEQVAACREQIGDKNVLLALSGGVDSSVVAALLIKAVGKQLICVHVNHGLMRKGESEQVVDVFQNQLDANLVYVDATDRFLSLLDGVAEPEAKRKIIGAEFIRVFEEEARKVGDQVSFLAPGHHLPRHPRVRRREGAPQRGRSARRPAVRAVRSRPSAGKDEVRVVGRELGLPRTWSSASLPGPWPGRALPRRHHPRSPRGASRKPTPSCARFANAGLEQVCVCPVSVPDFRVTGVKDGKRLYGGRRSSAPSTPWTP